MRPMVAECAEAYRAVSRAHAKAKESGDPVHSALLWGACRSTRWALEYMVTGYIPDDRRRVVLIDPLTGDNWLRRKEYRPGGESAELLPVLEGLSERQREAVGMICGEGLSYGVTAALMGISRGAVQKHVDRARGKLRSRMN